MTRSPIQDAGFMVASLATNRSFLMLRDERPEMRTLLRQLAAGDGRRTTDDGRSAPSSFDGVYADQLNMATYALDVPAARRVLDEHNILWALCKRICSTLPQGPRRWALEREWRLLRGYEREMSHHFDAILTVSEADRAAMAEVADGPARIEVMPIAIDPGAGTLPRHPDGPHILHLGTMFWPPNSDAVLWFAREVYPRIKARLPNVRFSVVGADPPPEVCALADEDASIVVTGYVPDAEPIIRRSSLLIVPLRAGSGMRVKILNALAQGLPVVTTTIGYEGIAAEPGRDLLVADAPEAFAEACLRVLTDEALACSLTTNGRRLVEQVYDYRVACSTLDRIFQ
jgi:glycosyltransferase involved in cell wall biosynthesis